MDHGVKEKRNIHPQDKANLLSLLTFFYTFGIFKKGYKKKFEEEDLYEVLIKHKSSKLGDELEKQLEIDKKNHKVISIYRLLWVCYGKEYLVIGFVQLIMRSIMVTISPWAIGRLISYFNPSQTELTKEDAYFYAALVVGLNLLNYIYLHNYLLVVTAFGIKIRTAFCSLMYRKSLKLTPLALSEITMGKIVTLITKDVGAFEMITLYGNDVWVGFVQAAIVCYLIYSKIGVAAFAGVGFFLLIMPFQIYIGKKATALRMEVAKKTDERLQVTQETLSAIKIIKMYTWESFFGQKINEFRKKEVKTIVKIFLTKIVILLIGGLTSKIAFYLLIMSYVWLGHAISAEMVFFILTCFQRLRHALSIIIPLGITEAAELQAAVERIGNLLKSEELSMKLYEKIAVEPKASLKDVTVKISNSEILHNVSITFKPGLTVVTGPVGSGKSSLLKTILRDYPIKDGTLTINGRVCYASQEPWIFPSTIKQNILYGERFNSLRYQQVLDVCALNFDLNMFQNKDNTIIGDRGLNLSRGQKARINLARAVYRESDIYLLDDCLTSLDANVKEYVFEECIKKFLAKKICIMVTHNSKHIQACDNLVIMKDGTITSSTKCLEIPHQEEMTKDLVDTDGIFQENHLEEVTGPIKEDTSLLVKPNTTTSHGNIYHEVKKSGRVEKVTYKKYIKFGGGYLVLSAVVVFFLLTHASKTYTEKMVSRWVDLEQNISEYKVKNLTNTTEFDELTSSYSTILSLFSTMIVSTTILSIITAYALFNFTRKASKNLHKTMLSNVMNAVMFFFDSNFIGNILNRFSKDLATIDEQLPFVLYEFFDIYFAILGVVILIVTVNAMFLIPVSIFFIVLYIVRWYYLPTGRNLQRLDAATRSPIIGYLNASLEGLTTIRAYCNSQKILTEEFDRHQDLYTSANYTLRCCMRAFGFLLDILCSIFTTIIVVRFLVSDFDTSVGDVGLALTQAFTLTGLVQYGVRQWADLENKMTSVERVLEYTGIKQENKSGRILQHWPQKGTITFENVSLVYSNSNKYILNGITFTIEAGEQIGIVGRTGAGKSSIIATLLRLYDFEGKILIDQVDTKTLALDFLRKNIAVIPQDPVLFTGSIRKNVDPMGKCLDADIWKAIKRVELHNIISSLDFKISDSSKFSAGQKQLICLARSIVSRHKIIVLDEATANMDHETELLIHNIIKDNFGGCTVVVIAHRLQSILNYSKVMVVDKGSVIEFDSPSVLLQNQLGAFYQMVEKAGLL